MKIELGKCYRRRDGKITGPIRLTNYPFTDPKHGTTYSLSGREWEDNEAEPRELIEECINTKTKSWFVLVDATECVGGFDSPTALQLSHHGKGNWIEIVTDENGKLISARNV